MRTNSEKYIYIFSRTLLVFEELSKIFIFSVKTFFFSHGHIQLYPCYRVRKWVKYFSSLGLFFSHTRKKKFKWNFSFVSVWGTTWFFSFHGENLFFLYVGKKISTEKTFSKGFFSYFCVRNQVFCKDIFFLSVKKVMNWVKKFFFSLWGTKWRFFFHNDNVYMRTFILVWKKWWTEFLNFHE